MCLWKPSCLTVLRKDRPALTVCSRTFVDHKLTTECILTWVFPLFHWSVCLPSAVLFCLHLLYDTCLKAVSSEACASLLSEMASLFFGLPQCLRFPPSFPWRGLLLVCCVDFDQRSPPSVVCWSLCRAQCTGAELLPRIRSDHRRV